MALQVNQARREEHTNPASPIQYTFHDLRRYANRFKESSLIGAGGFGKVYKATIPRATKKGSPTPVAIKVAIKPIETKLQFKMELKILGAISHPNIIKLIGYSTDNKDWQCLVYEYMPKKTVHHHIPGLYWSRFIRILKGVASALHFLHEQNPEIIFRDLKPENILLDEEFNAKLTDFGYAKQGNEGETIGGTLCYADPIQYDENGNLTTKCDVFTFGMLMLELITKETQKVLDRELLGWVLKVTGTITKIVHPDFKNKNDGYTDERAEQVITLALRCVGEEQSERPTMEEIYMELGNF